MTREKAVVLTLALLAACGGIAILGPGPAIGVTLLMFADNLGGWLRGCSHLWVPDYSAAAKQRCSRCGRTRS